MKKTILNILGIFLVGIIAGIIAQQIVWPWLLQYPYFAQYRKEETPVHITETEKIYIQENTALEEAVDKVENSVIGVRTVTKGGKTLEGSGLIITSDGLAITLAELIPMGSDFSFYINDEVVSYQILKRDLENNLALVKLGKENLKTLSFAAQNSIKLGEKVFLLGYLFNKKGEVNKVVNEGTIRFLGEDFIKTNIQEEKSLIGSPLIDIEGGFLGLNIVSSEGKVKTIPINKIKDFTGF